MTERMRVLFSIAMRVALLLLLSVQAIGQDIELTPQQQMMLNQLPPAQRLQAMDMLRQLQSQQQASKQTVTETIQGFQPEEEEEDALDEEEDLRAEPRSRLVIGFQYSDLLTETELRELEEDPIVTRIVGTHYYELDEFGVLTIQGLGSVPLLGLAEDDIQRRLEAESLLAGFDIDVRILEQELIGIEALQPFGYDIFEPRDTTLAPPTTGPVPGDYVLGPGDTVQVQLFGNVNGVAEYEVSRDGVLTLPEIGPVPVAGIPFSEFRKDLRKRVNEMLIGTQVSVSMGQLRTIRVFVLGDANQPGSYVVSGLSTISSALYDSGGIDTIGSLRRIQLKRNGKVVSTFDLYDLLLRGDTSNDARLQPGDVIFIPPVGDTVGVAGAVKRPAIYETKGKTSVADVVRFAGGLTSKGYAEGTRVERIENEKDTLSVDLTNGDSAALPVADGDTVIVPEVLPTLGKTVVLAGHVFRPGNYPWRPGMRLTDLIRSTDELKSGVDTDYILVRRERQRGRPVEAVSANLAEAIQNPSGPENIRLEASDTVHVFSLDLGRQRVVEPLLDEIRMSSTVDSPSREVHISGDVRAPGVYPLEDGMRVSDLVRAGGNLSEAAYPLEAELTRYAIEPGANRDVSVLRVDLGAIRNGDLSADIELREHDYLIISRKPNWDTTWTVSLEGEVMFPGEYRVRRGETLGELLQRAGGLTQNAFAGGAVFLRESLKEQEAEQIETLARRLEADLASVSLQDAATAGSETLETGEVLLDQLRNTEPVGRLVIDLGAVVAGDSSQAGVEVRDGDRLLVPTNTQMVTVIGETQQNTSHLYRSSLSRDDYINLSGGLTRRADKRRIYVVRANGAVIANTQSRWLGRSGNVDIRPGDTIVVPLDADRMRPLTLWTSVTQIMYQGAIALAAIRSFNR